MDNIAFPPAYCNKKPPGSHSGRLHIQELLLPVVPDVLHIVIIFHGVDELLHHDGLLLVQGLVVLGDHLDLGGDESRPKNRGF